MKNEPKTPTYLVLKPERKIPPTIIFSKKALRWISELIDAHDGEIGFYGVVDSNEATYTYYVRDIFYPKHQLVTSATCEISAEGEAIVMQWLIEHGREDDVGKMLLWGHSHHSMGVSPSGQDDKQALERMASTKEHVIRIIVNKEKLMSVSFFDYKQQIRFDSVKWSADEQGDELECVEMASKIRDILAESITAKEKLKKIDEIMYSDKKSEEIKAKILELKKVNVPTVSSPAYISPVSSWVPKDDKRGVTRYPNVHDHFHSKDNRFPLPNISRSETRQMDFLDEFSAETDMFPSNGTTSDVSEIMSHWDGME